MGNTKADGTLFLLPREIRDEIYRYLVKGHYSVWQFVSTDCRTAVLRATNRTSHLAIFQVSKAIHDEATLIFYSESVFRYHIDMILNSTIFPPTPSLYRMMNIEFIFDCHHWSDAWYSTYGDGSEHDCKVALDVLSGLGGPRNTLMIKFKMSSSSFDEMLLGPFFGKLKALLGFRTVIVIVAPRVYLSIPKSERKESPSVVRKIEDNLVPTMGPATVSHVSINTFLKFHPLEHMRTRLSV